MPNNEYGDFQTPIALARRCLQLLAFDRECRVLEPTCGLGSFLQAASELAPDSERVGIEIQPEHAAMAAAYGKILNSDIFHVNLARDLLWESDAPLMVVGNPPWVTSAELNRMGSQNLPKKKNFKGARGLDALLGSSNFDVCEYIICKILTELRSTRLILGMLCKTHVARNVIEYAHSARLPIVDSAIYRIDAMKWFNAGVDACWFTVTTNPAGEQNFTTAVFGSLDDRKQYPRRFGLVDGRMVSDVERYVRVRAADGASPYEWRSGLKHDASSVFELVANPQPTTRAGQALDVEPGYVFPFLKSTDIFRGRHETLSKWVIVPQGTFGADTAPLAHLAPKLWQYLNANSGVLDARKSSIYRKRPRFSVFGHGPYTCAPYKVAISGLHKMPVFRLVAPINGQPVVLDDTCYFLAFEDATEALVAWAVLSSPSCKDLIESLVFWDAKRPITKKILSRIDVNLLPFNGDAVRAAASQQAASLGVVLDKVRVEALLRRFGAEEAQALF